MFVLMVLRSVVGEQAVSRVGRAVAIQVGGAIDDAVGSIRQGCRVCAERLSPRSAARHSAFEQEAGIAVAQLIFCQFSHLSAVIRSTPVVQVVVAGGNDVPSVARQQVAAVCAYRETACDEASGDVRRAVGPARNASAAVRPEARHAAADEAVADDGSSMRDADDAAMCAVAPHRTDDVHTALATLYRGILRVGRYAGGELGRGGDAARRGEVVYVASEEAEQSGMVGIAMQGESHGVACPVELALVLAARPNHGARVVGEVDVGLQHGAKRGAPRVDAGCEVRQVGRRSYLHQLLLLFVVMLVRHHVEPRDAVLHIFLHPAHFDLIRAASPRIDLYCLVQNGPSHEVEALRLHQLCGRGVDVSVETLCRDAPFGSCRVPHGRHRVAKNLVGEQAFEQCPCVAGTATGKGEVVALLVGGEIAVVVVEGIIEVPDRTDVELLVVPLFRDEATPEGIGIAGQLFDEEVLQEAPFVESRTEAQLRVVEVGSKDGGFHAVELVFDVLRLLGRDVVFVGTLDGDRSACLACEPRDLPAGVAVEFEQVAARQRVALDVPRLHLCDVHAVLIDRQLVGELVAATVFAVDDDVHRLAPRHIVLAHATCYLEGYKVAHQRLVVVVVDECPLLCLRLGAHVGVLEDAVRLVELDAVGLLGMLHRSIAAQSRRAALFLNHRAVGIDEGEARSDFVHLVVRLHVVGCMEGDGRQVGQLVEACVVALSGMAVELDLRHVAARIGRTDVAHKAEAARHLHVGIAHLAYRSFLIY